jgi:hypothetical protein
MSRWTGDPFIGDVLKAADAWRKRCVEVDGSLFSEEPLWTKSNIHDLQARFSGNPITGTDQDFYEKLQQQVAGATPAVIKLASEVVWFLLLFPHHSKFGTDKKLSQIRSVWEWSGSPLPQSEYLHEKCLMGVGNPGTAYLTRRNEQFGFVLEVFDLWKGLDLRVRQQHLTSRVPWDFVQWIDTVPASDRRPVRNAILYFLFPDTLERNLSNDHRRQIVEAFKDRLPVDERPRGKRPSLTDLDKAIAGIRQTFERDLGTKELDFYRSPIYQAWWTGLREEARDQIASEIKKLLSKYGLELRQCGNKKAKLADCYPTSAKTGFWSDPSAATNKPLRWILHFELADGKLLAKLAGQHGDRRIAFANTAQGTTGAITVRIIPAFKLKTGSFAFYETWEWLLLLHFMPALAIGSSGQLFEDFDPSTGRLKYQGKDQKYIGAALIALNEEDDVLAGPDILRPIRYSEATDALASLIRIDIPAPSQA